jgi:hypothetical protein
MMRRQKAPEKLFYQFRLEDHVPADHPLRQLDAVLNFDQTRTVLARPRLRACPGPVRLLPAAASPDL